MALNPKEMGDAIARNMKEKTGKSVEEWVRVMQTAHLTDKKQVIAALKSEHKLGHYQAVTVWEHMQGAANDYDDGEALVNALFAKHADQRGLYDVVVAKAKALGPDVRVEPCKTYVPFSRNKQFAIAKPSKAGLVVGFALSETDAHPRLQPARRLGGSDRITQQMMVHDATALDAEFESVMRRAYAQSG